MESPSLNESGQEICWFCKKGRHSECMKQIPINYGDTNYDPLFQFGFGLSYNK